MAIRKFKIEVTRVDEYEVQIDDEIFTPEAIKEWESVFWEVGTLEKFSQDFAVSFMRSNDYFIEGYGYVKKMRSNGSIEEIFINTGKGIEKLEDNKYAKGLAIKELDTDQNYSTEITEL